MVVVLLVVMRTIVYLQDFGGNRYRNLRRLLAVNSIDTDRAGHARKFVRIDTTPPHAGFKITPFRSRTDQTKISEIVTRQNMLTEALIDTVIVRHHQEITARRCGLDFCFGSIGADGTNPGWCYLRQNIVAGIDPVNVER